LKENAFYQAINLDRRLSPLQGLTPDYLGTLKLHGNVQEGESAALDEEGLLALAQGDLNTGEGPIDVTEEEKEVRHADVLLYCDARATQRLMISVISFPLPPSHLVTLTRCTASAHRPLQPHPPLHLPERPRHQARHRPLRLRRLRREEAAYDPDCQRYDQSRDRHSINWISGEFHHTSTDSPSCREDILGCVVDCPALLPRLSELGLVNFQDGHHPKSLRQIPLPISTPLRHRSLLPNNFPFLPFRSIVLSFPQPAPTPGLPQPLLLIILQQILEQLQTIESALSKTEARFVGMSLLVIYEGDEEALRQALLNQPPPRMDDEDGSAEDDDDDDDDDDEEDEDSLESGDELDDDEMGVVTSSSRQRKKTTSSVVVKLIDFAHSRVVDKEGGEQGPDLGVLTGIGTIVELVEGRLGEVILMDSGSRSAGGPAREMA
jgi:hypothetical protein